MPPPEKPIDIRRGRLRLVPQHPPVDAALPTEAPIRYGGFVFASLQDVLTLDNVLYNDTPYANAFAEISRIQGNFTAETLEMNLFSTREHIFAEHEGRRDSRVSGLQRIYVDTKQRADQINSDELREIAREHESVQFGYSPAEREGEVPLYFGVGIPFRGFLYTDSELTIRGVSVAQKYKDAEALSPSDRDREIIRIAKTLVHARRNFISLNFVVEKHQQGELRFLAEDLLQQARDTGLVTFRQLAEMVLQDVFPIHWEKILASIDLRQEIQEANRLRREKAKGKGRLRLVVFEREE